MKKTDQSSSEQAYIKAIPADERALAELKKDQAEAKKKVGDADRVLKREKPNLVAAQRNLENFQSSLNLIGIDFSNLSLSEVLQPEEGKILLKSI